MGQCLSFQKIITTVHKQRTVYKHSMHNIAVIKTIFVRYHPPSPPTSSPHQPPWPSTHTVCSSNPVLEDFPFRRKKKEKSFPSIQMSSHVSKVHTLDKHKVTSIKTVYHIHPSILGTKKWREGMG